MAPLLVEGGNELATVERVIDSSSTGSLISAILITTGAVVCVLLMAIICGCCGPEDDQKRIPETGTVLTAENVQAGKSALAMAEDCKKETKQIEKESVSKSSMRKLKIQIPETSGMDNMSVDLIPHQNRKGPPPKHNIPLAKPGSTVPPTYMPEDDDRTVQTDLLKKAMSGLTKV